MQRKHVSLRHDLALMGMTEAAKVPYREQADYEMGDRELNKVLYHVSPVANRSSLEKDGLEPHVGENLAHGHKYIPATYAINCTRQWS